MNTEITPSLAPDPGSTELAEVLPLAPVPLISFVIACYNRRDVVLRTLAEIQRCGLGREDYEILLVDNASTDGTSSAVAQQFPHVHLLRQSTNRGPVAKSIGMKNAAGRFVVLLDDDSWPMPGSIQRMIRHFDHNPNLGAAGFNIHLPDGSQECSAYPDVFIGCGVGLRRRALLQVGYLPEEFFMAAEEYDLSLRLLAGGWQVRTFDDLHVTHLKTPGARFSDRIMRLDVRNNLTLIFRYFPARWIRPFAWDWMKRYYMIAAGRGLRRAFFLGLIHGIWRALKPGNRRPISNEAFESFSRINEIESKLRTEVERLGLRTVLFIDLGKNVHAYHRAAKNCGLTIVAIADNRLAGWNYRGIPILTDDQARALSFDAGVVSNLSPVHARSRRDHWRGTDERIILDLTETPAAQTTTPDLLPLLREKAG